MARTKFQTCMSRRLKGKMAGKTKAKRDALFSAASKACSRETGGTSKPRSRAKPKPRKKSNPHRSTARSVRTIVKQKIRSRAKGKRERQALAFKRELNDIARSLGVPVGKATIKVGKTATTIRIGSIIKVKRAKMSEGMRIVRARARKRL